MDPFNNANAGPCTAARESCLHRPTLPEPVIFTSSDGMNSFNAKCVVRRHQQFFGSQYLVNETSPAVLGCIADRDCSRSLAQTAPNVAPLLSLARVTPAAEVGSDVKVWRYFEKLQPFVIRGGASELPAIRAWSDAYLLERAGGMRSGAGRGNSTTFAKIYRQKYFSGDLHPSLAADVPLPPSLRAARDTLEKIRFWYTASGWTSSFLHRDEGPTLGCSNDAPLSPSPALVLCCLALSHLSLASARIDACRQLFRGSDLR